MPYPKCTTTLGIFNAATTRTASYNVTDKSVFLLDRIVTNTAYAWDNTKSAQITVKADGTTVFSKSYSWTQGGGDHVHNFAYSLKNISSLVITVKTTAGDPGDNACCTVYYDILPK